MVETGQGDETDVVIIEGEDLQVTQGSEGSILDTTYVVVVQLQIFDVNDSTESFPGKSWNPILTQVKSGELWGALEEQFRKDLKFILVESQSFQLLQILKGSSFNYDDLVLFKMQNSEILQPNKISLGYTCDVVLVQVKSLRVLGYSSRNSL